MVFLPGNLVELCEILHLKVPVTDGWIDTLRLDKEIATESAKMFEYNSKPLSTENF